MITEEEVIKDIIALTKEKTYDFDKVLSDRNKLEYAVELYKELLNRYDISYNIIDEYTSIHIKPDTPIKYNTDDNLYMELTEKIFKHNEDGVLTEVLVCRILKPAQPERVSFTIDLGIYGDK